MPKSCRTCLDWTPEPQDMPQPDQAWCHQEMRETVADSRCEEWKERVGRDFGPQVSPKSV